LAAVLDPVTTMVKAAGVAGHLDIKTISLLFRVIRIQLLLEQEDQVVLAVVGNPVQGQLFVQ